jgi:SET domain-containing protein
MPTKTKSRSKGTRKSATSKKTAAKKASTHRRSPPGKAGPINEWLEVHDSSIHGLGVFARRDIPKGTRMIEYTGEKIGNAEADRRYDDDSMARHHTFLFILNSRTCVDAAFDGNEARFINHSCGPNAEAVIERGHIWIDAIRAIPADTEITYDYQYEEEDDYTEEDLRFYVCKCGAPNCRGTIVKTRKKLRR